MEIHSEEDRYKCSVCEKCFGQSRGLKRHMRVHTVENPYTCSLCEKSFSLAAYLTRHMKIHSGEKPHVCTVCGKAFTHSGMLVQHMRTHTGEKPYKCTECEKSCTQYSHLKTHMRIHTGEKPYTCTECEKSFVQASSLKLHMRIHTGENHYTCTVCEKSFIQSSSLKLHMRVHTGEKPYRCTVCEKSFTASSILKQHMMIHTGERPYTCTVCEKSFRKAADINRHMNTHLGVKPYICTLCGQVFTKSSDLSSHMRKHTGGKPNQCTVVEGLEEVVMEEFPGNPVSIAECEVSTSESHVQEIAILPEPPTEAATEAAQVPVRMEDLSFDVACRDFQQESAPLDKSLPDCQLDDVISCEQPVTFHVIDGGSLRGGQKLVSSDGYTYTVRKRKDGRVYWTCSIRGKKLTCYASVKQFGEMFTPSIHKHQHRADPGALKKVKIVTKVKEVAWGNVNQPAGATVESVMRDELTPEDFEAGTCACDAQLIRMEGEKLALQKESVKLKKQKLEFLKSVENKRFEQHKTTNEFLQQLITSHEAFQRNLLSVLPIINFTTQ